MRPSAEQQLDNEARRLIDLAVQIALKDSDTEDVVERDVAQDVSAEPELFGDLANLDPEVGRCDRVEDLAGLNPDWFPWPNQTTCTLDIISHLPQSVFSEAQLTTMLWLLEVHRVGGCPHVKTVKRFCNNMQKIYGFDTIRYEGKLGNIYHVNSLSQILANEMANPRVREHLHFLPEDAGKRVLEARQAARWLHELPSELTTPSVRIGKELYFTYGPALARGECRFVIPIRWFTRQSQIYAKCWKMEPTPQRTWRAIKSDGLKICSTHLLKPFPSIEEEMTENSNDYIGLPPIDVPKVLFNPQTGEEIEWKHSTAEGNPWRVKARGPKAPDGSVNTSSMPPGGARVVCLPIWLYCDDTSGNKSKKWNAHNSFLFTLAGLPRSEAAKEYNVRFLCTSNSAPPLEMPDGIVEQIEAAQRDGIWAWDCQLKQPILVFPVVLALLGDNPMHSEMASHIGLQGRLFCRMCKVLRGHGDHFPTVDESSVPNANVPASTPPASPNLLPQLTNLPSPTSTASRWRKAPTNPASVDAVKQLIHSFLMECDSRNRDKTYDHLRSYFADAQRVQTGTAIERRQTATGVKDTFLTHFLNRIFAPYKGRTGDASKAALESFLESANFPRNGDGEFDVDNMINPVWRIWGLDAHADTPVKILHVVLLGFIKYFWRDVIRNQLGDKAANKAKLIARLNSLDVSGLNISPVAGRTLVNYSGSLVGLDFCVIAQVAPFVLYDLVDPACYDAWVALSKLVPLIWQAEIGNIEAYTVQLKHEIAQFLLCTAKWTTQWFNKPKFHIIVHLPNHIRRFGPAILFATEAFESFNAVIREKSIHSNRAAPSLDIARAFAQTDRLRHLASGGMFLIFTEECVVEGPRKQITLRRPPFSAASSRWASYGSKARHLLNAQSTVCRYLGIATQEENCSCKLNAKKTFKYSELHAGKVQPSAFSATKEFHVCTMSVLRNGDRCFAGNFVVVAEESHRYIGEVLEMGQRVMKNGEVDPDYILVARHDLYYPKVNVYQMPYLKPTETVKLLQPKKLLCTVNVQHTCADLKCKASGTEKTYQEREEVAATRKAVAHTLPNHQRVLNTAQMRDAKYVQGFRIPPISLERDSTIFAAAEAMHFKQTKQKRQASDLLALLGDDSRPATPATPLPRPHSVDSIPSPPAPRPVGARVAQLQTIHPQYQPPHPSPQHLPFDRLSASLYTHAGPLSQHQAAPSISHHQNHYHSATRNSSGRSFDTAPHHTPSYTSMQHPSFVSPFNAADQAHLYYAPMQHPHRAPPLASSFALPGDHQPPALPFALPGYHQTSIHQPAPSSWYHTNTEDSSTQERNQHRRLE